jgi:hypothetical protein
VLVKMELRKASRPAHRHEKEKQQDTFAQNVSPLPPSGFWRSSAQPESGGINT